MAERVDLRRTESPGPRTRVTLDVAEVSLPVLLAGIDAARCWLTDEGDGVYAFHATQTLGESRRQPGKPAVDVLVETMNRFADELDRDDVPQRLRDIWADLVDEYRSRTSPLNQNVHEEER